jgi:hypothetical protein
MYFYFGEENTGKDFSILYSWIVLPEFRFVDITYWLHNLREFSP